MVPGPGKPALPRQPDGKLVVLGIGRTLSPDRRFLSVEVVTGIAVPAQWVAYGPWMHCGCVAPTRHSPLDMFRPTSQRPFRVTFFFCADHQASIRKP